MPFRPRKKKNRQAKYHRCSRCGSQVRKRSRPVQALLRAPEEVSTRLRFRGAVALAAVELARAQSSGRVPAGIPV